MSQAGPPFSTVLLRPGAVFHAGATPRTGWFHGFSTSRLRRLEDLNVIQFARGISPCRAGVTLMVVMGREETLLSARSRNQVRGLFDFFGPNSPRRRARLGGELLSLGVFFRAT